MAYLSYGLRKGKVLKLRRQQMLSQDELAAKAGVSSATIVRVEAGARVGRTTVRALAEALNVATLDLIAAK